MTSAPRQCSDCVRKRIPIDRLARALVIHPREQLSKLTRFNRPNFHVAVDSPTEQTGDLAGRGKTQTRLRNQLA